MRVYWVFLVFCGRELMSKLESNKILWVNTQERSPERFGFTEKQAAIYRESILNDSSEWIFLYQRDDTLDKTGKESWWVLYNTLANNEEYWMSAIESSILAQMWSVFKDFLTYTHHIEAGAAAWKANKWKNDIYPHFWKYKRYGRPFYIDVDTSWSLLQSVLQEFNETGIPAFWLQCDWRSLAAMDKYDDKVFYLLWWSIGNFADDQVIEILRNFRSDSIFKWRNIILTQFLKPEDPNKQQKIEDLLNQYRCKEVEKWIMKWCAAIGIDTTKCRFCVEYEENNTKADRIKVGVECLEEMEVDIGWGKKVVKQPWEKLRAISSKRWSKEQFSALVEKTWCTMEQIFTDDQKRMAVHVLKTPPKRMSLATKITAAIAWSLLLLLGWVEVWKYSENQKRQKIKNHATEEIFLGNKDLSKDMFNSTVNTIIYDLEYVYWNVLTEAKKHILNWLIQDFLIKQKQYFSYDRSHWMWEYYYTGLYTPTFLHSFVATYKQTLLSMQINIVPYEDLLQYQEALQNSYFYDWDRLEFNDNEVDQKIWDYAQYTGVTHINGVYQNPEYWHYPCGIKNIWWKQYFVLKTAWSKWFVLQPKSNGLQSQGSLCSGDIVSEIIWRGEVSILAEKIRLFLNDKYWTEKDGAIALNWQNRIAQVVLDLYAQWRDLSFLVSDYAKDNPYRWYYEEMLEKFIFSYVLPVCQSDLRDYKQWNSWNRMYDIDWKKIDNDTILFSDYSLFVDKYDQFLRSYIPEEYSRHAMWTMKSVLLKLFLVWQKDYTNHPNTTITVEQTLHDPQLMRAWVTKHRDYFIKAWIKMPEYPLVVEEIVTTWKRWKCVYKSDDTIQGVPAKEAMYHGYIQEYLRDYTDIQWNKYDIWVSTTQFFSTPHLVARMRRDFQDKQLLADRKNWKYGKVYLESDIQPYWKILLTDETEDGKKQLLSVLRNKIIGFSSADMHLIVNDFKQWMHAMEKINK